MRGRAVSTEGAPGPASGARRASPREDESARQARRVDRLHARPELRATARIPTTQRGDPQLLRRRGGAGDRCTRRTGTSTGAICSRALDELLEAARDVERGEHESRLMRWPPSRGSSDPACGRRSKKSHTGVAKSAMASGGALAPGRSQLPYKGASSKAPRQKRLFNDDIIFFGHEPTCRNGRILGDWPGHARMREQRRLRWEHDLGPCGAGDGCCAAAATLQAVPPACAMPLVALWPAPSLLR